MTSILYAEYPTIEGAVLAVHAHALSHVFMLSEAGAALIT